MIVAFDQVSAAGLRSTLLGETCGDRGLVVRSHQDCAAILEENRRQARDYSPAPERRGAGFRHIARIPFVVMEQFKAMGLIDENNRVVNERDFLQTLSDPNLRWLRVDNGKPLA